MPRPYTHEFRFSSPQEIYKRKATKIWMPENGKKRPSSTENVMKNDAFNRFSHICLHFTHFVTKWLWTS